MSLLQENGRLAYIKKSIVRDTVDGSLVAEGGVSGLLWEGAAGGKA